MTFETLKNLCEKYHIPPDVDLYSDSGWECGPTDMNGVYYNAERKALIFSQGRYFEDEKPDSVYSREKGWQVIYYEPVESGIDRRLFGRYEEHQ